MFLFKENRVHARGSLIIGLFVFNSCNTGMLCCGKATAKNILII